MENTEQFETKLEYQSPELTEYGSVEELTTQKGGPGQDLEHESGPID